MDKLIEDVYTIIVGGQEVERRVTGATARCNNDRKREMRRRKRARGIEREEEISGGRGTPFELSA